jgi:hypothetical protein
VSALLSIEEARAADRDSSSGLVVFTPGWP